MRLAALQRERRADGQPGPRPDPAAAVGAEVVERMAEMAVRAVPAERQTREADVHALGRLVERVAPARGSTALRLCACGSFFLLAQRAAGRACTASSRSGTAASGSHIIYTSAGGKPW